ncbi:amidase domain-containing protein [Abyssisolibacter fermentans]|uniref:amidase domain-containing protein n=1 Tax=Abyssisolibacter fermentans TaxID=1766203 RepID=UPI00082AF136|nr:amidase domain-containing protein [Abyssisolibacter fermentans]
MYRIFEILNDTKKSQKLDKKEKATFDEYLDDCALQVGEEEIKKQYNELQKINKSKSLSIKSISSSDLDDYSRYSATTYAKDNYDNQDGSDKYPYLSSDNLSDCANFVSQCLHEGGLPMDNPSSGDWYIKAKVSNPNKTPENIEELDEDWSLADPSPWISAKEFDSYWSDNCYDTDNYEVDDLLDTNESAMVYSMENSHAGDPVVFIENGWFWDTVKHITIISCYIYNSDYDSIIPALASHTNHYEKDTLEDVAKRAKDAWGGDSIVKIIRIKENY